MEKKKNYVQPESTCVEVEVNGIICASSGESPWGDQPGENPGVTPAEEYDPWNNNK